MTADRDALVKLISDSDAWMLGYEQDLADEIIAAGWRAPEAHVHDWHRAENHTRCECGATAKQHFGVWVITNG